ncbi:hypothetical protein HW511_11985 [Asaia siamensis]|uniref:Uncharacterized protein n=1 Tax=Asaia siamensis TaxID=110479 RepID=A0ABQ1MBB0_9PROT|nr:hypothetical protein [Asaia siamensis]GBR07267.1 hypothetical protein AA0323_1731 [Asaia siamensis NRIC 0323]GGC37635.1 hypothetical protein GCM10007207_23950 [Asaia siamensis]
MTWRPSANILRPLTGANVSACPSVRSALVWPPSALNGGGDYSIDFDGILAPGEYIVSFVFDAGNAADQAWTSLFGTIATVWLRWKTSGMSVVTVCALTSHGNTHQVEANIMVSPRASLFPVSLPTAPETPALPLSNATMDAWLGHLPTDPAGLTQGWFNNGGIPTRLGNLG